MSHVQITGALLIATFVWQLIGFARIGDPRAPRPKRLAGRVFLLTLVLLYGYWLFAGILLVVGKTEILHATAFVYGQAGLARGSGLVLFVFGNVLLASTRPPLGRNLQMPTTVPRDGNTLATTGPYRFIRHPIYLADVVLALGLGLVVGSWIFPALGAVVAILLPVIVAAEEADLAARFGESWSAYARRTARVIPGVW